MQLKTRYIENIRPLTTGMLELLMDCHEREILNQEPADVISLHARGLIVRRLVSVEPFITRTGKMIMSLYITDFGKRFLTILLNRL